MYTSQLTSFFLSLELKQQKGTEWKQKCGGEKSDKLEQWFPNYELWLPREPWKPAKGAAVSLQKTRTMYGIVAPMGSHGQLSSRVKGAISRKSLGITGLEYQCVTTPSLSIILCLYFPFPSFSANPGSRRRSVGGRWVGRGCIPCLSTT